MLKDISTQLRENARLRWGLLLMVGIAWLYTILILQESLQQTERQYRATTQSISRLQAQLAQPEWIERAAAARTLAVQLEGRLWQAPTSGLAQATFQDWLNSTITLSKLSHAQTIVTIIDDAAASNPGQPATGATSPQDLWKVKARLVFDFNPAQLMEFMGKIERHDKTVSVGMLSIRKQPSPRVELELFAYFQKRERPDATQGKELVPL